MSKDSASSSAATMQKLKRLNDWYWVFHARQPEIDLVRRFRDLEYDLGVIDDLNDIPHKEPSCQLELKAKNITTGRDWGTYNIDANDAVMQSASVGMELWKKLQKQDDEAALPSPPSTVEDQVPESGSEKWSALPDWFKKATISLPAEELTTERRKVLAERFPDVTIREHVPEQPPEQPPEQAIQQPIGKDVGQQAQEQHQTHTGTQTEDRIEEQTGRNTGGQVEKQIELLNEITDAPTDRSLGLVDLGGPARRHSTGAIPSLHDSEATAEPETLKRHRELTARNGLETFASSSSRQNSLNPPSNDQEITSLIEQLGLKSDRADAIWRMYDDWNKNGHVRRYPHNIDLQVYYTDLIYLYIIAYTSDLKSLAYSVLLRFQVTILVYKKKLPDFDVCAMAFEHLPDQSPLCCWIVIVFTYLWDSCQDKDYEEFRVDNEGVETEAICRFLHGIVRGRDEHTLGEDKEVDKRWCEVHEHETGSQEEALCLAMREQKMKPSKIHRESKDRSSLEDELKRLSKRGAESASVSEVPNPKRARRTRASCSVSRQTPMASETTPLSPGPRQARDTPLKGPLSLRSAKRIASQAMPRRSLSHVSQQEDAPTNVDRSLNNKNNGAIVDIAARASSNVAYSSVSKEQVKEPKSDEGNNEDDDDDDEDSGLSVIELSNHIDLTKDSDEDDAPRQLLSSGSKKKRTQKGVGHEREWHSGSATDDSKATASGGEGAYWLPDLSGLID